MSPTIRSNRITALSVIRSTFEESVKELNQADVDEILKRAVHALRRLREIAVELGYLPATSQRCWR